MGARRDGGAAMNLFLDALAWLTDPAHWQGEFIGALKKLDLETFRQRESELNQMQKDSGLSSLSDAV